MYVFRTFVIEARSTTSFGGNIWLLYREKSTAEEYTSISGCQCFMTNQNLFHEELRARSWSFYTTEQSSSTNPNLVLQNLAGNLSRITNCETISYFYTSPNIAVKMSQIKCKRFRRNHLEFKWNSCVHCFVFVKCVQLDHLRNKEDEQSSNSKAFFL